MFEKKDMVKVENDPGLEVGLVFRSICQFETEKFFRTGLGVLRGLRLGDQSASLKNEW